MGARHHSLFVYRSDLDVDNWAAWLTDDIVEIDIVEVFPVADQIYDSEILAIRQSILEEAGLSTYAGTEVPGLEGYPPIST